MKIKLLYVLVLFWSAMTQAQDFQKKKITLLPSSSLTIIGDSNIAKFQCEFDTAFLDDSKMIHFSQERNVIKFSGAILTLDNRGFDCGSKGINRDFHDLLRTKEHPKILLELNKVDTSSLSQGTATICITIAGMQKFYDVQVSINSGEISRFKGRLKVNIKDFNLEPPKKLFGMIVVKDVIEIDFDLMVKK